MKLSKYWKTRWLGAYCAGLLCPLLTAHAQAATASSNVSAALNDKGTLRYRTTARGDRMLDFSYAGYMGGGVALPLVPVKAVLAPSGDDDTDAIQSALDALGKQVSEAAPGALLLRPGVFHLKAAVMLHASGVVLRGSGKAGAAATTLELTGAPHFAVVAAVGARGAGQDGDDTKQDHGEATPLGPPTTLADTYLPAASNVIEVADAEGLHAGDTVLLVRPVTPQWLAYMGMDKMMRDGKPETWVKGTLTAERIVAAVRGNSVLLTVPLADDYDPKFGGGKETQVFAVKPRARLRQVGIEDLRIVCPVLHIGLDKPHFDGVVFNDVEDGWMRGLKLEEVTNAVSVGAEGRRITIEDVDYKQTAPIESSAKPFVFSIAGTQVLVQHVTGTADSTFYYATQARMQGPNVLRDCVFHGNGHIQPHQRWATGLLVETCQVPDGGIDLQSRGTMGSGHGWPIGWSVLWNNRAGSFVVQNPPGSLNWSIGNVGKEDSAAMPMSGGPKGAPLPSGIVESPGKPVPPESLYREQLRERLAAAAAK